VLRAGSTSFACADCHRPEHGFTEPANVGLDGRRNTLSLLNVALNASQFWDGRAVSLEEVVVQSLDDEIDGGADRSRALQAHRFGGVARRLDAVWDYRDEVRRTFGSERVTQDAVAKALATFLRTVLSGDSLFDRACELGRKSGRSFPGEEHYIAALNGDDAAGRFGSPADRPKIAERFARGQAIFLGAGGCAACHPPGTFTNHAFANVLLDDSGASQAVSGKETGRFAVLPIGLKDPALRGAYRVPTLRNLSSTPPYFHNGTRRDLGQAVEHFRLHLDKENPLLSEPLRSMLGRATPEIEGASPTLFSSPDAEALVLFLRALDGRPVDPAVLNR
jgi:cytochrome c peroxidase